MQREMCDRIRLDPKCVSTDQVVVPFRKGQRFARVSCDSRWASTIFKGFADPRTGAPQATFMDLAKMASRFYGALVLGCGLASAATYPPRSFQIVECEPTGVVGVLGWARQVCVDVDGIWRTASLDTVSLSTASRSLIRFFLIFGTYGSLPNHALVRSASGLVLPCGGRPAGSGRMVAGSAEERQVIGQRLRKTVLMAGHRRPTWTSRQGRLREFGPSSRSGR